MKGLSLALIVTADKDVRTHFARLLNRAGIPFIFETDQSATILRLLEFNVKVVILDIELTNLNGKDFLKLIKKLRPRVPVITLLPDDVPEIVEKMLECGSMLCLVKKKFTSADETNYLNIMNVLMQIDD